MEDKIRLLKDLRIARECALNYDYVPSISEVSDLIGYVLPSNIKITTVDLECILTKYEGNSVNNIDNLIITAIDEL